MLGSVETPVFEDAWEAFRGGGWLPTREENRLRLIFATAAKVRSLVIDESLDVETVLSYIAAHDQALDEEIGEWVALDPGNAAIRQIIEAYAPRRPRALLDALARITADAEPQRRLALCKPFFDVRPDELLEALSFHRADQHAAADLLVARYKKATKNSEREQVLLLWRALRPTEDEPRRQLIKELMVPMATLNGEALDLVLREIDLARQPPRTKSALRTALREGGDRFKRKKQVRAKLESLGWSRRTGRLRYREVDVD